MSAPRRPKLPLQPKFAKLTRVQKAYMDTILERVNRKFPGSGGHSLMMDLSAACATTSLDLRELATCDDFTFAHDILGIIQHMNRKTGRLGNCFVPRCADRPESHKRRNKAAKEAGL